MDATKKRYAVRMAPCSSYDVERMANWLEDMAQRGYILDDTMGCLIIFRRDEPQKLRYRLCELPEESLFNDRDPSEVEELIAICEASGWHYVAKRGLFGIFATADETLPELQTEANPLYKRYIAFLLYTLIGSLVLFFWPTPDFGSGMKRLWVIPVVWFPLLFWGQMIPRYLNQIGNFMLLFAAMAPSLLQIFMRHGFFHTWQTVGSAEFVPALFAVFCVFWEMGYFIIGPLKYFVKMLLQKSLEYRRNWRKGALLYRATTIGLPLSMIAAFCFMFS